MNKKAVSQLIWLGISIGCAVFIWYFFDFGEQYKSAQIVASIAALMSILWITEAVPLAVTSLIPLILFPLTGVVSSKDISQSYINSTIFLFMGGFIIAIAMERWNLHKRIALNVIEIAGKTPSKIIFGFMIASAFISMWISNTATAVMLLPIGLSIIYKLDEEYGKERTSSFAIALMLGIAYSCSIGGIATPIGTPPNLVFQRIYKINFPDYPEIYFGDWMKFAVPIALAMIIFVWFLLTKILFRNYNFTSIDVNLIKEEKLKLGRITYEEKIVAIIFLITSLLWIFRAELDLGFFKFPVGLNCF